jgi:HAD superfamily hydrolase (TIGR01509 family)
MLMLHYYSITLVGILVIMITTVIFDYYGVFRADSYTQWLNKNGLERAGRFEDLIRQVDRGFINQTEFTSQLSDLLGRTVAVDEIHSSGSEIDQAVVDIANTLKASYKLALLSNAGTSLKDRLSGDGILHLFDEVIVSSEVGRAKPDTEIFRIALHRLNIDSKEAIFIDDSLVNVEAARSMGIESIRYTDARSLKDALLRMNIST